MPHQRALSRAGNTRIQDGSSTTGVENYKEFWYSVVGLASLGQSFDGNGEFAHFLAGNGGQTLLSAPVSVLNTKIQGLRLLARSRCRRRAPARPTPPKSRRMSRSRPATPRRCPNFNGPLSQGPADGSGG